MAWKTDRSPVDGGASARWEKSVQKIFAGIVGADALCFDAL